VSTLDIDQAKADGHDVSVDAGAYVQTVNSGTPAARAGIEVGDVVIEVDGKKITGAASLGNVIRLYKPGDKVEITVDRNGATKTFTATLGEAPTS
jgi:serine protease Do